MANQPDFGRHLPFGNGHTNNGSVEQHITNAQVNDIIYNYVATRQKYLQMFMDRRRDIEEECGYVRTEEITADDYYELYEREPIAERVVSILPSETWQVTPNLVEDEDLSVETDFEAAFNEMCASLSIDTEDTPVSVKTSPRDPLPETEGYGSTDQYSKQDTGDSYGQDAGATDTDETEGSKSGSKVPQSKGQDPSQQGQDDDLRTDEDAGPQRDGAKVPDKRDNLNATAFYKGEEGNAFWEYLERADRLAGIGHYGAILLGVDDGKPLSEPLDLSQASGKGAKRKLLFMRVLDETKCRISTWETDRQNRRFGKPKTYQVSLTKHDQSNIQGHTARSAHAHEYDTTVHWTRIVHIVDTLDSSEVFHVPRMRTVWNRLYDLHKLYGGSAEMYWQAALPGISFETHPQLGGSVDIDVADMREQLEKYMNSLQRYLALPGMSANQLSPTVVDPSNHIDTYITAICINKGIPKRIFMGSERGELSSSQDLRGWLKIVKRRQSRMATPRVIVPVIDRLIRCGVLPAPQQYDVMWPDVANLTDAEKAGVATQVTTALSTYVSGNVESVMQLDDFYVRVLGFEEDEALQMMENTQQAMEQQALEQQAAMQSAGGMPGAPLTDDTGQPILDEQGQPLTDTPAPGTAAGQPLTDSTGTPILDADGQPLTADAPDQGPQADTNPATAAPQGTQPQAGPNTPPQAASPAQGTPAAPTKPGPGATGGRFTPDPQAQKALELQQQQEMIDKGIAPQPQGPPIPPKPGQDPTDPDEQDKQQQLLKRTTNENLWPFTNGMRHVTHLIDNRQSPVDYATVMAMLDDTPYLKDVQDLLDPDDVVELEDTPHVTLLHGLHDDVNPSQVQQVIDRLGIDWLSVGVQELDVFKGDKYDVLHFRVDSPTCKRINAALRASLPHTSRFPKYRPHVTVAYLKPGTGAKYKDLDQREWVNGHSVHTLVFSTKDREWSGITLRDHNTHDSPQAYNHLPGQHDQSTHGRKGPHKHEVPDFDDLFEEYLPTSTKGPKGKVTHVKDLGGSNGASLVEDEAGNKWIMKPQKSIAHAANEYMANKLYGVMDVEVPDFYWDGSSKVTYTSYLGDDAVPLYKFMQTATPEEIGDIKAQLQNDFAADATLANWDVIGLSKDNIMIKDGTAYRIDNGGALFYRAQGGEKGSKFDGKVGELDTMRQSINPSAKEIFGGLSDSDIKKQAAKLVEKQPLVMKALDDKKLVTPMISDYTKKLEARFSTLDQLANAKAPPTVDAAPAGYDTLDTPTTTTPDKNAYQVSDKDAASVGEFAASVNMVGKVYATKGGLKFTPTNVKKLIALNKDWESTGVFKVPLKLKGADYIEHFKQVLPPGTTIKPVNAGPKVLSTKGLGPIAKAIKLGKTSMSLGHTGKSINLGFLVTTETPIISKQGGKVIVSGSTMDIKGLNLTDHKSVQKNAKLFLEPHKFKAGFSLSVSSESLTQPERNVISSWGGAASPYRKSIGENAHKGKLTTKDKHLLSALQKLPAHTGKFYRQIKGEYAAAQAAAAAHAGVGAYWADAAPMGVARITNGYASGAKVMLVVHSKSARAVEHLTGHTSERELIIPPHTPHKIIGLYRTPDATGTDGVEPKELIIELEEV